MVKTFAILDFDIGICLGVRAWNLVFEAELCSGGVYPRLSTGSGQAQTISKHEIPMLKTFRILNFDIGIWVLELSR
jgi:hypothetical protein